MIWQEFVTDQIKKGAVNRLEAGIWDESKILDCGNRFKELGKK